MITSSSDIYQSLIGDALVSAIAKVRIIEGSPSLRPEDGTVVYISKYPQDGEFEVTWFIWIVDFDNEPLDVIVSQIRRSFPALQVIEGGPILRATIREVKTTRTELAPPKPQTISIEPYLQKIEERFEELRESIDDRMLLVNSGRPGRDGRDGKDGRQGEPGRDGRDLVATEANLDDIRDVAVGDAKKGDVLTYDGDTWVAKFVEQRYGAGGGLTVSESDILAGCLEGGEPMGHADRTESTMTFDDASRTLTIAPVNDSFKVWVKGKRFIFYSPQSIQIPDETRLYYVYFSQNGVLEYQEDYFYWDSEAPTAYVYWDADLNVTPYFADERHGIVLDWQTHEYLHRTRGAVLANGFAISNYTIDGTGAIDAHAQFDIANGTFFDEDLEINITHSQTPLANSFQQDLRGPARIPVFYKIGSTWKIDAARDFAFKSGTLYPYYNSLAGGAWGTTEVETNRFVNYYIVATHNLRAPIISLMGQSQYTNIGDAQSEAFTSLDLSGFPSKEFRFLYKITFRTGNYGNSVKSIVAGIQDLRSYVEQFVEASTPIIDGDKGDITVSNGGETWTVDDDAITYSKIQNVSTTDRLLGRSSAGAGNIEEIVCTSVARQFLDDATADEQRTTIGAAPLVSPAFSGTPTTPTAATATNNTQIASTAFVRSAIIDYAGTGVAYNAARINTSSPANAFTSNINGLQNTVFGAFGLQANTAGSNNTGVGAYVLQSNTSGTDNVAIGSASLVSNTTGRYNVAIGVSSLYSNTIAAQNVCVGYRAGQSITGVTGSTVAGYNNTAVGYLALTRTTTGDSNVGIGALALEAHLTGYWNTFVGNRSGVRITDGARNTAVGFESQFYSVNAYYNTSIGDRSLHQAISNANTAVGTEAGFYITSGGNNVCVGLQAGADAVANLTTQSNYVVLGNNSTTNANIKVAWTVTSDARDKCNISPCPSGLAFVSSLKPVRYQYRQSRDNEQPGADARPRYGFLAQDILALEGDEPVIIDNRDPDSLKFNEASLTPVLVNAIKDLHSEIKRLRERIELLERAR